MKLSVGKSYKNRKGEIHQIVSYEEGDLYPFWTNTGEGFQEDGTYNVEKETPFDLISEVEDSSSEIRFNELQNLVEIIARDEEFVNLIDEQQGHIDEWTRNIAFRAVQKILTSGIVIPVSALDGMAEK